MPKISLSNVVVWEKSVHGPPAYEKPEENPEGPQMEDPPKDIPSKEIIIQKCQEIAPRVGKVVLEGGECFQLLEKAFPEYQLRVVEICKGTDRYRKPPVRLVKNEAPLRKYLGIHRQSQEIFESNGWEAWENWSNRKLIEKGQPARMLVTIFGKSKAVETLHKESKKREAEPETTEPSKKMKHHDDDFYREILGDPEGDSKITPPEMNPESTDAQVDIMKNHHGEKFVCTE